jgi:ribosome-associated translation inhibitor RaiA
MQTDIYYRDITKTDALENYLLERVERVAEGFFKWDRGAHLTVRVEADRRRKSTRKPSYTCEVILKPMRSKGVIKVLKSDENFKACVAKTTFALKNILSKNASLKQRHHRRDPALSLVPSPEELELMVGA